MIDYSLILLTMYPGTQWSIENNNYNSFQWFEKSEKPTQVQLDALWPQAKEATAKKLCKMRASELLQETDWSVVPDVANQDATPRLANQADFVSWRNQIRALVAAPVENPIFPEKPKAVWA